MEYFFMAEYGDNAMSGIVQAEFAQEAFVKAKQRVPTGWVITKFERL